MRPGELFGGTAIAFGFVILKRSFKLKDFSRTRTGNSLDSLIPNSRNPERLEFHFLMWYLACVKQISHI